MDRRENKRFTRLAALILALVLVPVFAVFGFAAEGEEPEEQVCYVHGDLNGDKVVDGRDAIYMLYHTTDETEGHPLNQDGDFDGDTEVTAEDAIWLLYASLGILEDHALQGEVHVYTNDVWTWAEDGSEATVTLGCACGSEDAAIVGAAEVETKTSGSCTVAGAKTYTATYTHENVVYTAQKSETLDAPGHQWKDDIAPTCETGATCETCGFVQNPLGHIYSVVATDATCMADGYETYSCGNCDLEPFTVVMEGTKLEHDWDEENPEVKTEGCAKWTVYTCKTEGCGATAETEKVTTHTYTAAITQEATCVAKGVKTYSCTCGESYTEEIETNENHAWGEGILGVDGVTTTYTCSLCQETKVSVSEKKAEVAKEDLANTSLELKDATVKVDQETLDGIEDDVVLTIQVEAVDVNTVDESLLADLPGEVANGKIYDFTMYAGDEQITNFEGEVTVSIPYTLQDGDDPDCIDVYYITDEGEVDCYKGVYANGQVTFTTKHFSYYTVTRLTAAERCAEYGHMPETKAMEASCEAAGYTLSTCQRCGEVIEKVIVPANGHAYEETRVEPTCTEGGSITKDCANCHSLLIINLPAVGHKWTADAENSFDATCEKDGQDARVCSNESCGATYIQVLEATGHSHVLDESKTVTADCTTDGYETYTCACGNSYSVPTRKATGHDYQMTEEPWTWSEDCRTATLTLVCSHNGSHTKVLTGTVTKAAEDCEGNVLYSVTAAYNNRVYTGGKLVETGVASHMPAEEWSGNPDNHFHICVRCGEELDTAAHNLGQQTVTKAPTCANTGLSMAVCTVCEYEMVKVIPATGTHSYVNGVCSACGIKSDACDHNIIKDTLKNVTPAGICSGSEIYTVSCACGKNTAVYIDLKCSIVVRDEYSVETEDGGIGHIIEYACENCGYSHIYEDNTLLDKEACERWSVIGYDLRMNGKTFALATEYMMQMEDHPIKSQTKVDLGALGLCGGELSVIECYCGLVSDQTDAMSSVPGCNWVMDKAKSTADDNYLYFDCTVCGAVKIVESEHSGDFCTYNLDKTLTYMKDGKILYQDTFRPVTMENHAYEIESWELHGTYCDDGISYLQRCVNCGKTLEGYARGHLYTGTEEVDISKYGFCDNRLVTLNCACGISSWSYTYSNQGNGCVFTNLGGNENSDSWACENCGLTHVDTVTYGQKDENCFVIATRTKAYSRDFGETLFTATEKYWTELHDMKTTTKLLGDSCEDGVEWSYTCDDCSYSYSNTSYVHGMQVQDSIDLSALGFCGGSVQYYKCPCGENEIGALFNGSCQWEYEGYADDTGLWHSINTCVQCGNSLDWVTLSEVRDGCNLTQRRKVTALVDGVIKDSMEYTEKFEQHLMVFSFNLQGVTCDDGYTLSRYCIECGVGYTDDQVNYGHQMYNVRLEKITDKTCSVLYSREQSCACGQFTESDNIIYGGQGCGWEQETYVESLDRWVGFCDVCGIGRYTVQLDEQPTEDPCKLLVQEITYFINADLEEVDRYTGTGYQFNHNNEIFFEMLGDTCEDGYYTSWKCRECGEESRNTNLQTGCFTWDNGWVTLYNGEGICGPIKQHSWISACGIEDTGIEYTCEFNQNYYDEELNGYVWGCMNCGAERINYTVSSGPDTSEGAGPCDTINLMQTIIRKKGEVVATYEFTTTGMRHDQQNFYEMLGDSCEDGYIVISKCARCGAEFWRDEEPRYSHNRDEKWQGWDLTEYGLCEGENISKWSCACGQYISGGWGGQCNWQQVGQDDIPNGVMYKSYCATCDTYRYSLDDFWVYDDENCARTKTFYHRYERGGQVLATITFQEKETWHDNQVRSFNLNGTSCEDGYTVSYKCTNCGHTTESGEQNSHNVYVLEDVALEDYGMCAGSYTRQSCACGQEQMERLSTNCDWHEVSTDANGVEKQQCANCGVYRDYKWFEEAVTKCTSVITDYQKIYNDQGVIKEINQVRENENHTLVTTSCYMNGDDCTDGYSITEECYYCDEVREYSNMSGHTTNLVRFVDLEDVDGACGGYIKFYSCPCGENSWDSYAPSCNTTWSSEQIVDEQGITHQFDKYTCDNCDFYYVREHYVVPTGEDCGATAHKAYSFYYGDRLLTSFAFEEVSNIHEFGQIQWSLMEGATSCDDGLIGLATCGVCGTTQESQAYGHTMHFVEDIEFGATCDTVLRHTKCVCGRMEEYNLDGDSPCDWNDVMVEENWIADAIPEGTYLSTDGGNWLDIESRVMTCAVTDPACGIVVRKATYWKAEGDCTANQYVTWQLGYDAATDTCERGITYKVGYSSNQYHDYTKTETTSTLASGNRQVVTNYVCNDCGSTVVVEAIYDENYQLDCQTTATNKQNNGCNTHFYEHRTYEYVFADFMYPVETLNYYERTDAEGDQYWYRNESVYNGCVRTYTVTQSDGETYGGTNEHCEGSYGVDGITSEPTCTQYGLREYGWKCQICHNYTDYDGEVLDPTGHSWIQQTGGSYKCEFCDTESETGIDGNVVLEDMGVVDGNYTIGYWNQGGQAMTANAFVYIPADETNPTEQKIRLDVPVTILSRENEGRNVALLSYADAWAEIAEMNIQSADHRLGVSFEVSIAGTVYEYSLLLYNVVAN